MTSLAILENGQPAKWRVDLANRALTRVRDGQIYQQRGDDQPCVIHACSNMGSPFDDIRHQAAYAVWEAVSKMRRPPDKAWREYALKTLRAAWERVEVYTS